MKLPSHIPVRIDSDDIEKVEEILRNLDYDWTFFQIVKPQQSFGLVKEISYNGKIVDHHVRCYLDGTITTELELRRLQDVWLHLTSRSISAHEWIIDILEKHDINYEIDDKLRENFKEYGPDEFERDYLELLRWFFYGVCFWTPIGYLWKFFSYFKNGMNGKV